MKSLKKKNNNIQSRDKPNENLDCETKKSTSIGLCKYHPDRYKILYCYPNSKCVYYGNFDSSNNKEYELLEDGTCDNIITSIDIGAKNKCATASSEDNKVILFNCVLKNDKIEISTSSPPTSIQFSPTQSYLAIGLLSGQIKIVSVGDTKQQFTINNAHNGEIIYLAYSSDGDYLASVGGSEDNKLKIWKTESFEQIGKPQPIQIIDINSSDEILKKKQYSISWRPNHQYELTIPTRSTIKSYQFDKDFKDYTIRTFETEGHTKEVLQVSWDSEGKNLASIGLDQNLFIWNGDFTDSSNSSDEPIYSYKHSSQIYSISWRLYPNSNQISFFDGKRLQTISDLLESESSQSQDIPMVEEEEFDDFEFTIDENDINNSIKEQEDKKKNLKKLNDIDSVEKEEEQDDDDDDNEQQDDEEIAESKLLKKNINKKKYDNDDDDDDNNSNYSNNEQLIENYQQESFQIGSTLNNVLNNPKTLNLKTKRYYMAYNMLGKIIKREENQQYTTEPSSIEIEFHETGYHKKITFSDPKHSLRLASLGPNGAVFATKHSPSEREEFEIKQQEEEEEEQRRKNNGDSTTKFYKKSTLDSIIMFKSFDTLGENCDWSLIDQEEISGVACSKNFIVSVSSLRTLRLFSLGGIQLNLFTIPGDLVTMNTFEDTLVIVYHRTGASINDNQSMNVWWINLSNGKQIYHDQLSISPLSTLLWIGFSDNGLLTTMDSLGLIRQLSNGWFNNNNNNSNTIINDNQLSLFLQWTLIMDLRKCEKSHSMDRYTYWIIGLNKTDLYSIFCTGYPLTPKCTHNFVKIETPLLSTMDSPIVNNEREYLKNKFNLSNLLNQNQNNLNSSAIISASSLDQQIVTKHLTDLDASILRLFQYYTKQGLYQKSIDLCKTLNIKKSLQIAFTYSNEQRLPWLSKKIVEIIENFKPFNLNNNINNVTTTSTSIPTLTSTPTSPVVTIDSPKNKSPKQQSSKKQVTVESEEEYEEESEPEEEIKSPPKSSTNISKSTKSTTSKAVKKAPFSVKKSSDSKKRKESQSNTQPSKISKFQ